MFEQVINVVAPVFAVAFVGYLFAWRKRVDLSGIADIVLYLAAPALVFASLAERELETGRLLRVGGGVAVQIAACGLATLIVFRLAKIRARGLALAAMFPNTGNLGLPLALFAFGEDGLAVGVLVFVAVTLVHYSIGLVLVSGSAHPGRLLETPLLYAAVLGVAVALVHWRPPELAVRAIELLGDAAIPLMLITLGARMRGIKLSRPGRAIAAVLLRMIPGFAAASGWCFLMGIEGPERGVLLVTGVLPSAVMNVVLAEAYGTEPEEVAATILLGTLASFVAVPAVLAFVV